MFQFYDEFVTEDGLRNLSDSIDVAWDTTYNAHRIIRLPRIDTVYEGPRVIVRDTVAVKDTSAVCDSLAIADTLAAVDSLLKEEKMPEKKEPKLKGMDGFMLDTLLRPAGLKGAANRQFARPERPTKINED